MNQLLLNIFVRGTHCRIVAHFLLTDLSDCGSNWCKSCEVSYSTRMHLSCMGKSLLCTEGMKFFVTEVADVESLTGLATLLYQKKDVKCLMLGSNFLTSSLPPRAIQCHLRTCQNGWFTSITIVTGFQHASRC